MVWRNQENESGAPMNINLTLTPLLSLIAGILILVMPRLLNFIVAAYLIAIGLVGLLGAGSMHLR
jgi:archaellum biogenesis protein FlaJ (TadC family)